MEHRTTRANTEILSYNQYPKDPFGSLTNAFERPHCPEHRYYGGMQIRACPLSESPYIQKWDMGLKDEQEWNHRSNLEYIIVVQGKDDGDFKIQKRRGIKIEQETAYLLSKISPVKHYQNKSSTPQKIKSQMTA